MVEEDFYERLKRLCRENNMSIEQLMTSCGLTKDTFAKWRKRQTYPRANNLLDISKLLGESMEYLMTGKERNIPPRLLAIIRCLENDEEKLEAIEALLALKKNGVSGIKVS